MASITQTRMTAAEFAALPETNLPTELINGEVITPPVPGDTHQRALLACAMLVERIGIEGRVGIGPNDVYLDNRNVVQPDVFWVRKSGSGCKLGEDDHWYGPPDLVVEVLSEDIRRRFDKVDKFRLYEKHGVAEYWIVEPKARYVEVWSLDAGRYQHRGTFSPDESFPSPIFSGKTVTLVQVFRQTD